MNRQEFERELGRPLIGRDGFVAAVSEAVESGRPFATGKIGTTEQAILQYPLVLRRESDPRRIRAFEISVAARALRHAGVFPPDPAFLEEFAGRLAAEIRELDCLGLFEPMWAAELELLRGHGYEGAVVHHLDQEPDRGIPADDRRCYLPAFRGRRILLVCPFAELLRERAERATYEAVWAKTGKRWFEPANVDAVSFPYGFEPETQRRYATSLDLLDAVASEIDRRAFDVALIAAGGLGIPLAARVKRLGAVGISLGGHLQIVFGVHGERWLSDPSWRRDYFNDDWTRVPPEYRPDPATTGENYW